MKSITFKEAIEATGQTYQDFINKMEETIAGGSIGTEFVRASARALAIKDALTAIDMDGNISEHMIEAMDQIEYWSGIAAGLAEYIAYTEGGGLTVDLTAVKTPEIVILDLDKEEPMDPKDMN